MSLFNFDVTAAPLSVLLDSLRIFSREDDEDKQMRTELYAEIDRRFSKPGVSKPRSINPAREPRDEADAEKTRKRVRAAIMPLLHALDDTDVFSIVRDHELYDEHIDAIIRAARGA